MRKFIVKFLSFLAVWVVFLIVISFVNRNLFDNFYNKSYTGFDNVILGDSRILHLNDKIIKNTLQLSSPGETAKVMYQKLKYFSEINDFSKAIISFNYGQLTPKWDERLLTDYHQINKAFPLSSVPELFESTSNISGATEILLKNRVSLNESFLFSNLFPDYRNIENPVKVLTGKHLVTIKRKHKVSKFGNEVLKKNTKAYLKQANKYKNIVRKNLSEEHTFDENSEHYNYLAKIAQLCKEKKIYLYLCTMPTHPVYRENIPTNYFHENKRIFGRLKKIYRNIERIQYGNAFDSNPDYFINPNHLNELGGAMISKTIVNDLGL